MAKFSEQTFDSWKRPASETEETRISHAITTIKEAIRASDDLKNKEIEIFVQGSYANNTNVRRESDVDVCIMLKDTFYAEYPENLTRDDYGFTEGTYDYSTYRKQVINALISQFGENSIKNGNKSIKIESNSQRVDADAVPSFQYRNYYYSNSKISDNFKEGIKFFSQGGDSTIINYPQIHIENGRRKNTETQRRFKRLARIFKRIRYHMIDEGEPINNGISSFLLECLLWNVPNEIYNNNGTWIERIEKSISYLYNKTQNVETCEEWREVSEILYLFHDRKWNRKMVNEYLFQMGNYLEF
ncbi:MAG: nucleotidyltransferase [Thiomargarita sp.]|nr:nucleotidyltransferase [Thiomargarita sp.]